jgi:hypothetical protein
MSAGGIDPGQDEAQRSRTPKSTQPFNKMVETLFAAAQPALVERQRAQGQFRICSAAWR